ncbi:MAG: hypothetical protein ACW964_12835 [Candidatus Hodarchaeales archaeon]
MKLFVGSNVGYTLSQHGVTTYSLPCDLRLWPFVVEAAEKFRKFEMDEHKKIIKRAKMNNFKPLFPKN